MPKPAALIPRVRVPLNEKIAWDSFEVADATGLSERYVRELAIKGFFKTKKIGRRTLFDPRQVRDAIFSENGIPDEPK